MEKMKKLAAATAALLISASTLGYLPQDSIKISNVTANAAEEEITSVEITEANFPDKNFREYVKSSFDKDGDGVLSAEEIAAVTKIGLRGDGVYNSKTIDVSDLSGIEYFTSLKLLHCEGNNLASLDLSNNTALEELKFYKTSLTTLDLSNNTALKILRCNENKNLTTLDLSNNTALTELYCYNNQFTSLDLSNNTALTILNCTDNQLTSLDLSKNTALTKFTCDENLTTLDLSKNTALTELSCFEDQITSLDLSNNTALKELVCYTSDLTALDLSNNTALEVLYFSYNENLTTLDLSNNTALEVLRCEYNEFTSLDVSNNTALTTLCCYRNQLTSLDVSNNTALETLWCEKNQLTSLDLSNNTELKSLTNNDNKYEIILTDNTFDLSTLPTGFDVSKASDWTNGTVKGNILTVKDASKNVAYKYDCGNGHSETFTLIPQVSEEITSVEINETNFPDKNFREYVKEYFDTDGDGVLSAEEITAVTEIDVHNKGISDLTGIEYFENLEYLDCSLNKLTTLDLNNNTALIELNCYYNQLTSLDVSSNTALTNLGCHNNQLTSLNVSNNTALEFLNCSDNQLTSLDLSNNTALTDLYTYSNEYEITLTGKTFDLSTLPTGFDVTSAYGWTNGTVKGNILTVVDASKNIIYKYDLGNGNSETFTLISQKKETPVETTTAPKTTTTATTTKTAPKATTTTTTAKEEITGLEINETNFPDSIFRQYVAEEFDINGDSVLSDKEIAAVTKIDVYDMGISDLTGIEYFENLAILECMFNKLTTLDISKNTALIELNCYHNQLTSLDVSDHTELIKLCFDTNNITSIDLSNNTALTYLSCCATKLTSIDISNNTALITLHCAYNQFTSLDVSNNTALTGLYCYDGQLTSLDISKNIALETLWCMSNQLTSLDVSKNTALTYLSCSENQLTSLDLSNNTALTKLNCNDNQLTSLDLSNNTALDFLNCSGNQLTSLDLSNNTALEVLRAEDNKYEIALTDNTFDLSTLPTGFDVTKASEWTNATVEGNILTIEDVTKAVTYKYDFGNEHSEVFTLVSPKTETPATTTTAANTTNPTTTTTTFATPSYSWHLNVYPYDKADTIYEIGEELDYSTICVHGYGGGEDFHADIPYISLANCSSFVTVDASEFDNTKPGTYTIYVKWHDAVDSFDVTVVESDNAETPAATETTPAATTTTAAPKATTTTTAAPKTTDTTTTTTVPKTTAMFTTTTFAPPSYSCSLSVYPYDEADTIYEIGEELDYSTICVHGYGTMTSFGSTTYMDIPYISLDRCNLTVDASEFDNTKPGTYTIYVEWYNAVDSFEVTVIDPDNPTAIPGVGIDETNFPDPVFRQYLAKNFDKNKDGRLSDKEIADVKGLYLSELGISDLTGIQHFENLKTLGCSDNDLTQLDISENKALTHLYCSYNNLTTLDTSNNVLLFAIDCHNNKLTKLDFSNNPELEGVWCCDNQLTSLDVSHNTLLSDLACSNNQLASIDLSNTICKEISEWGLLLYGNKHKITITDNTFDLSTLPTGFDVSKASDWTNATVKGNILTVEDITKEVTYTYDCGLGFSDTFTLIPQIEETPVETTTATTTVTTTTTTAAPETTTAPVTTTPATTTPEEDLPQTGFSKLYNCIPVSAGALVLLGMYAVKKSKKEDEEE
ncbi:MAG: hypothetical protein IJN43_12975 [Ruminococcus sp.]|nr:hypothetical protein [Ruminococcus sp.]